MPPAAAPKAAQQRPSGYPFQVLPAVRAFHCYPSREIPGCEQASQQIIRCVQVAKSIRSIRIRIRQIHAADLSPDLYLLQVVLQTDLHWDVAWGD